VEEKVLPIVDAVEDLKNRVGELSQVVRLIRSLNLRVEHLEARMASVAEEIRKLRFLMLGGEEVGPVER